MAGINPAWRPRPLARAARRTGVAAKTLLGGLLRARDPRSRIVEREARLRLEQALSGLQRPSAASVDRRVLFDASWDNPNYWLRLCLLRSALGIGSAHQVAFIGPHRRTAVRQTLAAIGIENVLDFEQHRHAARNLRQTGVELLRELSRPEDILQWKLPDNVPGSLIYDGILKRQRTARVDLKDPLLVDHVTEALQSIHAAQVILDAVSPGLVVLSHAIEFRYGAMAWCALTRGIEVVVAFGNYGSPRYARMTRVEHFFESVDRPSREQINLLSPEQNRILSGRGTAYLQKRLAGQTDDLGGQFAFGRSLTQLSRDDICRHFDWDTAKPIVAVYASNWFDYPHTFGMSNFTDFLDWLEVTIGAARENTDCNWLFRAHPCDDWYGGITLKDLMVDVRPAHVGLCPSGWSGAAVQSAADALVTVHGTAGLEYAVAGKPVLVADRGWYHDLPFVRWARTRSSYVQHLSNATWLDDATAPDDALAFAGVYFPIPGDDIAAMGDDSEQSRLIPRIVEFLAVPSNAENLTGSIDRWWASGARFFHSWRSVALAGEVGALEDLSAGPRHNG